MGIFGKKTSTLAKPSHEGGAVQRSGGQGKKLFGKPQKRLAPPSNVAKGKVKKTPSYSAPDSL